VKAARAKLSKDEARRIAANIAKLIAKLPSAERNPSQF
jgi:hypothetical protein